MTVEIKYPFASTRARAARYYLCADLAFSVLVPRDGDRIVADLEHRSRSGRWEPADRWTIGNLLADCDLPGHSLDRDEQVEILADHFGVLTEPLDFGDPEMWMGCYHMTDEDVDAFAREHGDA